MANNIICYLCDINLTYKDYSGTKMLDEDGNKPCFECLLESGVLDDATEETEDDNEF